ncbi:c-type cytochrome [Sphingomonas sp. CROZ-RG-20F-R02-07]|uniref:c-type cytochrome n=1 Tax=Sphingomonas sp. CROZ-RG-20F-R02-07 TaxID=2914832 RepID=UPI001F580427|nr:c-type cytochrome [Sphingomonas sp. CROZ-RG-20F-R02-07]
MWTILASPIAVLGGCGSSAAKPEQSSTVSDAAAGAIWISRSGCGSCHQIPGIMHASGLVGPPLIHFSQRTIIAGYLPNTRANLARWIQHPQQVAPGNAMPDAGLTDKQARDITTYLYGLK